MTGRVLGRTRRTILRRRDGAVCGPTVTPSAQQALPGRGPRPHDVTEGRIMSEAEEFARRALQESMDLRDQGHSDD